MSTERNEILEGLAALIDHAEHAGKWLHCSYQDLWFSPTELRAANAEGRMLWGPANWTLRDPSELIEQACNRVEIAKREHEAIVRRVGRTNQ